jgi:hypothetical protein
MRKAKTLQSPMQRKKHKVPTQSPMRRAKTQSPNAISNEKGKNTKAPTQSPMRRAKIQNLQHNPQMRKAKHKISNAIPK